MEIIIITSIVVAVFGAVALAWVLSQGGSPSETAEATEAAPDEAATNAEAATSSLRRRSTRCADRA